MPVLLHFPFLWNFLAEHEILLMFMKNASSVVRESMTCEVQLKFPAVGARRTVILVILREYEEPVPGFQ